MIPCSSNSKNVHIPVMNIYMDLHYPSLQKNINVQNHGVYIESLPKKQMS